jgi:ankyrin repeat protein
MPIITDRGIDTTALSTDSKKYLSDLLVGKTGINPDFLTWDCLLKEDKSIESKRVIVNELAEIETNYLTACLKPYEPEIRKQTDLRHKKRALISLAIIVAFAIACPFVLPLLGGAAVLIGIASLTAGAIFLFSSVIPAFLKKPTDPEWIAEYSRKKNEWQEKIKEMNKEQTQEEVAYWLEEKSWLESLANILYEKPENLKGMREKFFKAHKKLDNLTEATNLSIVESTSQENSVISCIQRLGLGSYPGGVCFGLAAMATQAFLLGPEHYRKHSHRLDLIERLEKSFNLIEQQEKHLEHLNANSDEMKKIKAFKESLELELKKTDIPAFLERVKLFFDPASKHPDLFASEKKLPKQQNVAFIAGIAQSQLAEREGGIHQVSSFCGVYSQDNMKKYLSSYAEAITNKKARCTLLLSSYNHAIMLAYDHKKATWFIDNHGVRNHFPHDNISSVYKTIRAAFNGTNVLETHVYATSQACEKVQSAIDAWYESSDWKAIQKLTPQKVETRGQNGETWLYMASKLGDIQTIKKLLDNGANINAATKKGETPFHIALENDFLEIAELFLAERPRCKISTRIISNGIMPLHTAVKNGQPTMVERLLANEAEVDAKTTDQAFTPLHVAAGNNYLEIASQLLDNGATINAQQKDGYTPLHLAAQNGFLNMVQLLLARGADANIRINDSGYTAYNLALSKPPSSDSDIICTLLDKAMTQGNNKVKAPEISFFNKPISNHRKDGENLDRHCRSPGGAR